MTGPCEDCWETTDSLARDGQKVIWLCPPCARRRLQCTTRSIIPISTARTGSGDSDAATAGASPEQKQG